MISTPGGSTQPARPRVVIAHDFLETYGGAERVTQEMAREFPDAPVWAIIGRRSVTRRMGVEDRFHALLAGRPILLRHYRLLTPLFPALVSRAALPSAEVLLTSSYAFAHRFRTANDAPQVCYCHSPLRFAWSMTEGYRLKMARGRLAGAAFDALAAGMRRGDRRSAERVDYYLTQSQYTADQIDRFYGRSATVIGAPVDCGVFRPSENPGHGDYFLFCGRLIEPYKRVRVVVEAFRRLKRKLVIAGDGPAMPELRVAAPANVEFLGHLADDELVPLMQRCEAAIFPSQDDFGLIPLEVMACGRPVLAYDHGGARHTVVSGVTGALFPEQTVEAVVDAVSSFDPDAFDQNAIRAHAEKWDSARFRARVREAVTLAASRAEDP